MKHNFFIVWSVLLGFISVSISDVQFPENYKQCHLSDPTFTECIIDTSKFIIPQLIPGEPKYHIPKLNPLNIPEIAIDSGNLHATINDVTVSGLEDAQLKDFMLDNTNKVANITLKLPILSFKGHYTAKGRVLLVPINGKGMINVGMNDVNFWCTMHYTMSDKGDQQYAKVQDISSTFDVKSASIQMDGLIRNNKEFDEQLNVAINQNWKDILADLEPGINEALRQLIKLMLNGVLAKVPFDVLFPQ